jgi:hypothetical protein
MAIDQSAPGESATERAWRDVAARGWQLDVLDIASLAQIYELDEATIKRLIFLRYRLASQRSQEMRAALGLRIVGR